MEKVKYKNYFKNIRASGSLSHLPITGIPGHRLFPLPVRSLSKQPCSKTNNQELQTQSFTVTNHYLKRFKPSSARVICRISVDPLITIYSLTEDRYKLGHKNATVQCSQSKLMNYKETPRSPHPAVRVRKEPQRRMAARWFLRSTLVPKGSALVEMR